MKLKTKYWTIGTLTTLTTLTPVVTLAATGYFNPSSSPLTPINSDQVKLDNYQSEVQDLEKKVKDLNDLLNKTQSLIEQNVGGQSRGIKEFIKQYQSLVNSHNLPALDYNDFDKDPLKIIFEHLKKHLIDLQYQINELNLKIGKLQKKVNDLTKSNEDQTNFSAWINQLNTNQTTSLSTPPSLKSFIVGQNVSPETLGIKVSRTPQSATIVYTIAKVNLGSGIVDVDVTIKSGSQTHATKRLVIKGFAIDKKENTAALESFLRLVSWDKPNSIKQFMTTNQSAHINEFKIGQLVSRAQLGVPEVHMYDKVSKGRTSYGNNFLLETFDLRNIIVDYIVTNVYTQTGILSLKMRASRGNTQSDTIKIDSKELTVKGFCFGLTSRNNSSDKKNAVIGKIKEHDFQSLFSSIEADKFAPLFKDLQTFPILEIMHEISEKITSIIRGDFSFQFMTNLSEFNNDYNFKNAEFEIKKHIFDYDKTSKPNPRWIDLKIMFDNDTPIQLSGKKELEAEKAAAAEELKKEMKENPSWTFYVNPQTNETQKTNESDLQNMNIKEIIQIGYFQNRNGQKQAVKMPKTIENVPNELPKEITSLENMFKGATNFNQNLLNWNTSNVTNMNNMFERASSFNGDISTWDTSKVTNMSDMFKDAKTFNKDLKTQGSQWNTSNVTNMDGMFSSASSFNGDISTWNTSKVTNMSWMFSNASKFNKDLKTRGLQWNTSNVRNMFRMFSDASSFNCDISNWDVKKVTRFGQFASGSGFADNKEFHPKFLR